MEPAKFNRGIAPGTFLRNGRFLVSEVICVEECSAVVRVRETRDGFEWMVRLVALPCQSLIADHHPNVLPTLGQWEEETKPGHCLKCFRLPLCAGGTLAERLRAKDFDRESAVRWLLEVAEALAFAHSRDDNLIHGHLRPKSVFLGAGKTAKVEGLVRRGSSCRLAVGESLWYFAPERSSSNSGSREDDVWALGLLGLLLLLRLEAHEILPLTVPLARRPALVHELVTEAIGVDAEVGRVIDLCLFERAAGRPSASFVARALRAALAELQKVPATDPETGRALDSVTTSQERSSILELLALARHPSSLVRRAASLAIVSLARGWSCEDSARTLTLDEERILCAELACCLEDASAEVAFSSVAAIRLLARTPAWRTRLVATPDLLPRLVGVFGRREGACEVMEALNVLSELTRERARLCVIHQVPGLVARVVGPLRHEAIGLREKAAGIIRRLAENEEVRILLCETPGLVTGLVSMLSDEAAGVREAAARTINCLALEPKNSGPLFQTHGLAESLMARLADESPAVRETAARALWNLAFHLDDNAPIRQTWGLLDAVVDRLADSSAAVREAALGVLWNLANNRLNSTPLFEAPGLVAGVVVALTDPSPAVREMAAKTVQNLAFTLEDSVPLRKTERLVGRLVSLLADKEAGAREAAAWTLRNLACAEDNQVPLREKPGLVAGLVSLLADKAVGAREAATGAIAELARDPTSRTPLFDQRTLIPSLLSLLKDSTTKTRNAAARALGSLASEPACGARLAHTAKLLPRVACLLEDGDDSVRVAAAETIGALASHTVNRRHIAETVGLMERLAALAKSGEDGSNARSAAQRALDLLESSTDEA